MILRNEKRCIEATHTGQHHRLCPRSLETLWTPSAVSSSSTLSLLALSPSLALITALPSKFLPISY